MLVFPRCLQDNNDHGAIGCIVTVYFLLRLGATIRLSCIRCSDDHDEDGIDAKGCLYSHKQIHAHVQSHTHIHSSRGKCSVVHDENGDAAAAAVTHM